MNEVEKMYENAGIEKMRNCENFDKCPYDWVDDKEQCKECEEPWKMVYPPFTAEKQIEVLKILLYSERLLHINVTKEKSYYLSSVGWCGGFSKEFGEAIASFANKLWENLTEAEQIEIKEILE